MAAEHERVVSQTELRTPGELFRRAGLGKRLIRRLWSDKFSLIAAMVLVGVVVLCLLATLLSQSNPDLQNILAQFQGPSPGHPLGLDEFGRDEWARVLYGGRTSLFIGLFGATGGLFFGVLLGATSAFIGGKLDDFLMRVVDIMLAFPGLLLAILIAAELGPGLMTVLVALTIWWVPPFARMVRGGVLQIRATEYVQAATALGASRVRILWSHVLPNIANVVIVQFTLSVATSILTAAGLSFLGLGVQPPTPEWGAMVFSGSNYLQQDPSLVIYPGLAIFITVMTINVLGDVLRDVLDPKSA